MLISTRQTIGFSVKSTRNLAADETFQPSQYHPMPVIIQPCSSIMTRLLSVNETLNLPDLFYCPASTFFFTVAC